MIREADREDQIAAARQLPKNVNLQLPDAPLVKAAETVAQNTTPSVLPPPAGTLAFTPAPATPARSTAVGNNQPAIPVKSATADNKQPATPAKSTVADNNKPANVEELPSFVPAPKSLISDQAAANVATVNPSIAGSQNAVLTNLPKAAETSLEVKPAGVRVAQLTLLPNGDVLKVGDKRRYAIQLNSDVPLSLALLALRFDPKVVKVHGLTAGSILPTSGEEAPIFTPVIDNTGTCLISISSLNGRASFKGSGPLLFIDVEAVGAGDASLSFVKETLHLVATDARVLTPQLIQGTATVKQ